MALVIPALVALGGTGNALADCMLSECSFVVVAENTSLQGVARSEDRAFDDRILIH